MQLVIFWGENIRDSRANIYFQTFSARKYPRTTWCLLILGFILCSFPLHASELYFDIASGRIQGFNLSQVDNNTIPSEIWLANGYVGRIVYSGPATTLTFDQAAPYPVGTPIPPKFYFIYIAGGNFNSLIWSEFSLAGKLRGTTHESTNHIDISNQPTIIDFANGTMSMKSAGSETWAKKDENVPGFDKYGNPGTKQKNNLTYQYKQQYATIWMDLIILRRDQAHQDSIPNGLYESNFTISTGSNAGGLVLTLYGEKSSGTIQDFLFSVENVGPSSIPFDTLLASNTISNAYLVGKITFLYNTLSSLPSPPSITIASNNGGSSTAFTFTSPGALPIPHGVAFQSLIPSQSRTHITPSTKTFTSQSTSQTSVIDNRTNYTYSLEGNVLFFLPNNTLPVSGSYSSTIYCILSAFWAKEEKQGTKNTCFASSTRK